MRPSVLLVVGWLAGTGAAVALGVQAVDVVTASVTEERPAPLSSEAVRAALTSTTTSGPPPGTGATATTGPTGPVTTAPTTTTAGPVAFPPAEDRTYRLTGGTVGVRFERGAARLLWATPQPGFRVETRRSSPRVDVRFESEDHESRLDASWDGGPRAEIDEDEDD